MERVKEYLGNNVVFVAILVALVLLGIMNNHIPLAVLLSDVIAFMVWVMITMWLENMSLPGAEGRRITPTFEESESRHRALIRFFLIAVVMGAEYGILFLFGKI
ncbi:MAG: hypothetical protein NTW50_01180 [Candidatus Berkelbacteria bacterium]|nr:hypothetical protein [Candidatus Berkelbacteria bacterium]